MKPALRIAFLYTLISGFYILVSDAIVLELARGDPQVLAWWQAAKGLAFVLVSAAIISLLVFHYVRGRDRAERQLAETRVLFDSLFARTPVPTYVCDLTTRKFLAVNEAAMEEYGYSRDEFLERTLETIYPEEDEEELRAHLARGQAYSQQRKWRHRRRDGTVFPVEEMSQPLIVAGRKARLAVAINMTVREMTEQTLAEAAAVRQEAEKARSRLLSSISHEMRTPLNGIVGGLELIAHESESVRIKEFVAMARNSAEKLLLLIEQVMDAAALRAPGLRQRIVSIDLRDFLRNIVDGFLPSAESRGITLEFHADKSVLETANLDASRFGETVRILLSNAVKFSRGGTVVVSARLQRDGERAVLEVVVADEGIGIPQDHQERVFDSFYQVDQDLARQYGGAGLGLFIARQLCELVGASLDLESEVGRGSTFTIRLPGNIRGDRFDCEETAASASSSLPGSG